MIPSNPRDVAVRRMLKFVWKFVFVIWYLHRVDREDSPIIILDTKLVPDFVMHACYFFVAGNRPVLKLAHSTSKRLKGTPSQ